MTNRLSLRSVLFPTITMITSSPRSVRTSSTHFVVFWKDVLPEGVIAASALGPMCCRMAKRVTLTSDIVYDYGY